MEMPGEGIGEQLYEKVHNGTEDWEIIDQLGYTELKVFVGCLELSSRY